MQPNRLLPPFPCLPTSREWQTYYEANSRARLPIPWERGAELTNEERDTIAASLAAWQLGETSDGSHLLAAARNYAERIGDAAYVDAVVLFIKEEQRHGNDIGRFLDLAGIPRLRRNWGDTLFRLVRYALPTMEVWTTPLLMVETLAMLYYSSVRKATGSTVLQTICRQILRDEVQHLRFQYERIAILLRRCPRWQRNGIYLLQKLFYIPIVLLVWIGHRRVFRAGGHSFRSYWHEAWARMGLAWRRMRPETYLWEPTVRSRAVRADGVPGAAS